MFVSLLLLTTSLLTSPAFAIPLERLEASVNNQIILSSDISKFKKTLALRAQLDPLFAGTTLAKQGASASNQDIVEFLINEKLITAVFPMSDSEVEQEINSIQTNNRIGREQIKAAISAQGFQFEDYFELIRIGASKRNLIDREIRTKVSITDDDVKNQYYNKFAKTKSTPSSFHLRIITTKNKAAAMAARAEVVGGTDFESTAKKYSEDASATLGGDMGTLSEEQMSPAIRKQVKKMRVGEVSPVLGDAKSGFLVLKLENIGAAEDSKLKAMSDEIRGGLANVEYQRQLALWLERQRDLAFIHRAGDNPVIVPPKKP